MTLREDKTSQSPRSQLRLVSLTLTAISILPLWVAARHHTALNDDTYITLTYAQNLIAGRGFVYNHPPPTLGTTTPFLALMVAGLGLLFPGVEVATLAVFLTALCWVGIGWTFLLFRRAWGLKVWHTVLIALVLAGQGWIGFLGMEAYLFAFLLVLTVSLFFAERFLLAGFFGGMLHLTRGEGILVFGLMGLIQIVRVLRQEGRFWRRTDFGTLVALGLGGLLPLSLWWVYAWTTFGQILPNTLAAKQAQGQMASARPFLQRLWNEWLPTWGRSLSVGGRPFVSIWWLLIGFGIILAWLNNRKWLAFLAWIALYVFGYTALQVSAYWWYQLPIHFIAQIFFALGVIGLIERVGSIDADHVVRGALITAVLIPVLGLPLRDKIQTALNYEGDPRAESYLELAEWFRTHTDEEASIAFLEIGYLGYYTPNRIVDLAGLVMPEVVSHVVDQGYEWAFWHYQPDYYVYLPDFDWALGDIVGDPRFDRDYEAVATLPGPRESDFTIYQRSTRRDL